MKNKKAIFLDIDGTLIMQDKGPFSDDLDAIQKARDAGNLVFINTGRSYGNMPPRLLKSPFFDGILCGAGSYILYNEKVIYSRCIPDDLLMQICEYFLPRKKMIVLEGETNVFCINNIEFTFMIKSALPVTKKDDFTTRYKNERITKFSMRSEDGGIIDAGENKFLSKYFGISVFPEYVEAVLLGESKSNGIKILSKEIGIKQEDCIAIGDSLNDLDMVQYAGLGVAMGNASDILKESADFITANCGCGGIAKVIQQYVL